MSTALRYSDLVGNPEFFLHELRVADGQALFVEVTRDSFVRSAFMDGRIAFTRNRRHGIALATLLEVCRAQPIPPRPVDFIFHISFCCSTLLARALQIEGQCLSIREPYALIDLANYKRSSGSSAQRMRQQWPALLDMTLTLLAKTYAEGERALIKPSNMANALIEDILAVRPTAHAIVLHCDLRAFLIANLKKREETQRKMWWLAEMFANESDLLERVPLDISTLSHPQAVALLWHMQMYRFARLLEGPCGARLASLDAATLLAHPAETLAAACRFLGIRTATAEPEAIAAGAVFTTHAKNPYERYSRADRDRENAEIGRRHAAEIAQAIGWSSERFAGLGIAPQLPHPLPGH